MVLYILAGERRWRTDRAPWGGRPSDCSVGLGVVRRNFNKGPRLSVGGQNHHGDAGHSEPFLLQDHGAEPDERGSTIDNGDEKGGPTKFRRCV
jgi:hypothetical protein